MKNIARRIIVTIILLCFDISSGLSSESISKNSRANGLKTSDPSIITIGNYYNNQPKITRTENDMINTEINKMLGTNRAIDYVDGDMRLHVYGKLRLPPSGFRKKVPVIVVQFWVELGNGDFQFIIILDRKDKKTYGPFYIGGSAYRAIAIYNIKNNNILACVHFYGPGDAIPEPSVSGLTQFSLTSLGLEENSTKIYVKYNFPPKGCDPWP